MEPSHAVVRYRFPIIILFAVVSLGFGVLIPFASVEPDIQSMIPEDSPSLKAQKRLDTLFGSSKVALVIMAPPGGDLFAPDFLAFTEKLSQHLSALEGVESVSSIAPFAPLLKGLTGEQQRAFVRENPMLYERLVGKELTSAAMVLRIDPGVHETKVVREIIRVTEAQRGTTRVTYGGMPFVHLQIERDVPRDMATFLPVGLLLMVAFLFVSFRELRGVVLPFLVVIMSICVGMGTLVLLGWKIQMITILLPVLLLAIANDYGIHLIAAYQEEERRCALEGRRTTMAHIAIKGYKSLRGPILAAGLTTMAGLLCLSTHIIAPARQLGVLGAVGIGFALLASLFFIPAVLSCLPRPRSGTRLGRAGGSFVEKWLHAAARLVARHPRMIVIGTVAFVGVMLLGIPRIHVDSNPTGFYPEQSALRKSVALVNDQYGGIQLVSLLITGDIRAPGTLAKMEALQRKIETVPGAGKSLSIVTPLSFLGRKTGLGKKEHAYLPTTAAALARWLGVLRGLSGQTDLRGLVTKNWDNAHILIQLTRSSNRTIRAAAEAIDVLAQGSGLTIHMSGPAILFTELMERVVHGQLMSLLLSLGVISLLVMLFFRSFWAGLYAAIPLGISLAILFGTMGYLGIALDISTALLTSVMIGVGVDYTIHFLWRYRDERATGKGPTEAVESTLTSSGRGILFNALSVLIGFCVLVLSTFVPIRFFGALIVLSITTCLISALVLLPALVILLRPRFLEPRASK